MTGFDAIYIWGFVLGGISYAVFILGHLGLLSKPYLAASVLISAAPLIHFSIKSRDGTPAVSAPAKRHETLIRASIVIVILLILPLALTPPSVRDELIQHLAVPKLYLRGGAIHEIPFMGFSYLPANIDLLYVIPLAFGSDTAPRLIHLGFSVLTGLLIYRYLLPVAGRAYALTGFLLFLSTPLVFNLSRTAYVDLAAAFYSTLALFSALRWDGERKPLVYSAAASGLAMGAKPNTVIAFALIAGCIVIKGSRRDGAKASLRDGALFVLMALAVLSPWLVRNYLWTGSPLYPLYENVAGAAGSGEGVHVTGDLPPVAKRFLLYGESLLDVVLLPLRLFYEGRDNSIERFDGVLNPFFLFFIPLAFLKAGRAKDALSLACFSALFFYTAFFTVDLVTRYLLPILPPLVVLTTIGMKNSIERRALKPFGLILIFLLLAFNLNYIKGLYALYRPMGYITGKESREDYLGRVVPEYGVIDYANRNLKEDSLVLFLFSGERGYYWERDYVYGDRMGVFLKSFIRDSGGDEGMAGKLTGHRVTHLFINERLFERFVNDNLTPRELENLAAFFKTRTTRLHSSNGFSLFELNG